MRKFLAALLLLPALACAQILSGTSTSTGFGATPGISGQTTQPSFAAALTTTIVPSIALGSPTATFTRATTATNTDWENIVRPALSGEARFQGARRVQNRVTFSQDLSNVIWIKSAAGAGSIAVVTANFATAPDGTLTASRLQLALNGGTTVGDQSAINQNGDPTLPRVGSVWLKANTGTPLVQFRVGGGAINVRLSSTWTRYTVSRAPDADATFWIVCRGTFTDDSADILVWGAQREDTTGESNTNPSEYVPTNVLAAPFQGANVDGVQYFGTLNGNTVASNVVTAGNGATIPSTTLLGYLAEGARTNVVLQSETFDNASWTKARSSVTANATAAPDGNTTADKLVEDATAGNNHNISQTITVTSGVAYSIAVWVKAAERTQAQIQLFDGVGVNQFPVVNLSTGAVVVANGATVTSTSYPNGWWKFSFAATPATVSLQVFLYPAVAGSAVYNGDGVSGIYLWGVQVEQAAFPSTYIPTTTVAVTRNADTLTYPAAGNMSASIGTAYAEVSAAPNQVTVLSFVGTSVTGRLLESSAQDNIRCIDSATNIAIKNPLTPYSSTVAVKRASSWSVAGGMSVTGDGAAPAKSAFASMDVGNPIGIGCFGGGGNQTNGTIRNVLIFPAQFTDAQLQGKTGP